MRETAPKSEGGSRRESSRRQRHLNEGINFLWVKMTRGEYHLLEDKDILKRDSIPQDQGCCKEGISSLKTKGEMSASSQTIRSFEDKGAMRASRE